MAYVLVAIGAVMAAAGLYTVAYSVLNTRFEEYWAALGVGATLTAGGLITIALGLAVRAIARLAAALETRPIAVSAAGPVTPPAVEPATPPPTTPDPEPEPAPILAEAEPVVEAPPPMLPAPTDPSPPGRAPHPLRPPPIPAFVPPFASPPATAIAERPDGPVFEPPMKDEPAPPQTSPVTSDALGQDELADFNSQIAPAQRPADDYKLETPSTPEHDLPERPQESPGARMHPEPSPAPEMPDDWLDRAFAELDDELPARTPFDHAPPGGPLQEPATRRDEPAPATAEPAHAAAAPDPAPPPSPPPAPPAPQVIGRYEADGTSYVMYADGSIEAQSSSGVYRFSSMAELKSFIET